MIQIEILNKIMLYMHIAAGFLSLVVGIVPMIARKGSQLHNTTGNIFYWNMMIVAATSLWLVFVKGSSFFLFYIALLTFQNVYYGKRVLKMKEKIAPKWFDWWIVGFIFLAGISMMGWAVKFWFFTENSQFLAILYTFFGIFLTRGAYNDLQMFRFPERSKYGSHTWLFGHIARMMGGYTATITAFATVNSRYLPSESLNLIAWIVPPVILSFVIMRMMRTWEAKLGIAKV